MSKSARRSCKQRYNQPAPAGYFLSNDFSAGVRFHDISARASAPSAKRMTKTGASARLERAVGDAAAPSRRLLAAPTYSFARPATRKHVLAIQAAAFLRIHVGYFSVCALRVGYVLVLYDPASSIVRRENIFMAEATRK